MTTATKKKSIVERIKNAAKSAAPAIVTDPAQERHPKAAERLCGASRNASGILLICELPLHHPGSHEDDAGRTWRRVSGDEDAA